ncbi:hypothetical protein B0H21DRAFT_776274 [Amylocystis lapponica]|nr:hypothetical protein B0H21DRAFT_776274 [Amylocystis lapponica]
METIEAFETTLKDVVQAKRLSASKMSSLTNIALKCMENDTRLVSILYRTHKALPTAAKGSSLYVFDALSRAARNQVNKNGLTVEQDSEKGNCATFLSKIEGILDSLFQDLVNSGSSELKEKAKKILDIWVKSSTFPSAVLARLSKLLKGAAEKGAYLCPYVVSTSHQSPPASTTPPVSTVAPTNGLNADSVQSTLLALLSQAANAVGGSTNGQTPPNTATSSAPGPVLNANQLALFQQLTHTAKLGSGIPTQPIPLPLSLVPSSSSKAVPVPPPIGGPSQPPPYRDDRYGSGRRESNYDRHPGPERGRGRGDYYDDRRDYSRGGFRGGPRGRARGRWDDHNRHRDQSRDRDWAPPHKGRRSRSRSPPNRHPARRDIRPYSPPRRPSVAQMPGRLPPVATGPVVGKDEFGRDLRTDSPMDVESLSASHHGAGSQSPPAPAQAPATSLSPGPTAPEAEPPSQASPPAQPAPTIVPAVVPAAVADVGTSSAPPGAILQQGLETFDASTFDPSSPASWMALGNAWSVTHGYIPSQEELMQFTLSGGLMGPLPIASQFDAQQMDVWQDPGGWQESGGGHEYGNGRGAGEQAYEQQSSGDGGFGAEGTNGYSAVSAWPGSPAEVDYSVPVDENNGEGTVEQSAADGSSGGATGRMERVGDKWVFVRREASEVA